MQVVREFGIKRSKARHNTTAAAEDETETERALEVDEELLYDTVILTTESKEILESRLRYVPSNESFPYEFVVNEEDVGQGSGNPNAFTRTFGENKFDADDVMISSMVSLKMQLHADSLLLNSCSNFHVLIDAVINENGGCGQVSELH